MIKIPLQKTFFPVSRKSFEPQADDFIAEQLKGRISTYFGLG